MKLNFLEFVHSLHNFEKIRNFQKLKTSYKLDSFENYIQKKIKLKKKKCIRISVVGTNGKGSVCSYLSSILEKNGFKVGTYTSPHLLSPLERIQINSKLLSIEEYNKVLNEIYDKDLEKFSYFEVFTLFAILMFENHQCDIEIYEAGIGGRLDATKVVKSDYVVFNCYWKRS